MGISAAMTPKERKQILKGLLDQGGVIHREGKRGTILHFNNGGHFNVPVGTSDYKARLAMRAEVKRMGLHWPLDPPDKKETTTVTDLETTTLEPRLEHIAVPPAVPQYAGTLPREDTYRRVEGILRSLADQPFWTSELSEKVAHLRGYSNSAGTQRLIWLLDFAGFRTVGWKPNRGGKSYQWMRHPDIPWPTTFAPDPTANLRGGKVSDPAPEPDVQPDTPTVEEEPVTMTVEQEADLHQEIIGDEDIELSLASEMETRALRAERERDAKQVALDAEKQKHAETRRSMMTRIAGYERLVGEKDAEITRLRSLLEERSAGGDVQEDSGVLRRAKAAEDDVKRLTDDLDSQTLLARSWQDRALRAEGKPPVGQHIEDGWWPLEPQNKQTIAETIETAKIFGLEVRVQARRTV